MLLFFFNWLGGAQRADFTIVRTASAYSITSNTESLYTASTASPVSSANAGEV